MTRISPRPAAVSPRRRQGSRFFKREQQRDALVSDKVAKMKADLAALRQQDHAAAARYVDTLVQQLEAQRDLSRTIVHVDMDGARAGRLSGRRALTRRGPRSAARGRQPSTPTSR